MKYVKSLSRLRNKLLIVALLTKSLQPSIAQGVEDACTPVVQACDRALADQDKVLNLKGKLITAQDEIIKAQDIRVTELEKKNNSIFSSPLLYVIVGLVVGGYVVGRVK